MKQKKSPLFLKVQSVTLTEQNVYIFGRFFCGTLTMIFSEPFLEVLEKAKKHYICAIFFLISSLNCFLPNITSIIQIFKICIFLQFIFIHLMKMTKNFQKHRYGQPNPDSYSTMSVQKSRIGNIFFLKWGFKISLKNPF